MRLCPRNARCRADDQSNLGIPGNQVGRGVVSCFRFCLQQVEASSTLLIKSAVASFASLFPYSHSLPINSLPRFHIQNGHRTSYVCPPTDHPWQEPAGLGVSCRPISLPKLRANALIVRKSILTTLSSLLLLVHHSARLTREV